MRERVFGALGLGKPANRVPEKEVAGPKEPTERYINIGTSSYLISAEARQYLWEIQDRSADYEKSSSILIIAEPHHYLEAQFNLYKFLEVFLRDNPGLIPKTVFLAEGFPANQTISLKPLVEVEPNPSEELIWDVLSTFLITGYMAYEWKYHHGIPIVGTEDPVLYQLASRFASRSWPDLGEESDLLWTLSNVARNHSIAATAIGKIRENREPILFVGSGHIPGGIDNDNAQKLRSIDLRRFFTPEQLEHIKGIKHFALYNYFKEGKIAFTYLMPRMAVIESARDEDTYTKLFRAQEVGDYRGYIKWLISERIPSTTSRPSPEAAAEFVKAYKKIPPGNPEAQKAYRKGLSLMAEAKFAEAAQEFSAASAADPGKPHYVTYIQESALKEVKSRILGAGVIPGRPFRINPSVKSDLPVFGPYIEKDHYERISEFDKIFEKVPGKQEVIDSATHQKWEIKYGGILQIKGAQQLGPENVRAFEERHELKEKGLRGGKRVYKIDIATKDDIAIECKNLTRRAPIGTIQEWIRQAASRFEPDIKGYRYKAVIIVIPDNQNLQEIEPVANQEIKSNYPEILGKVKICRLSEVKRTYEIIRKR